MKQLLFFLFAAFALVANSAEPGFKMGGIVLYQPDEVLRSRVTNVENLASYMKKLEAVCVEYFAKEAKPESLHIVVAVKPGKQARTWFVAPERKDVKALAPLAKKLQAIPAVEVFGGPVAFAILGNIAGASAELKKPAEDFRPPIPQEWTDAVKGSQGSVEVPDGFLAKVWPDLPDAAPKEVPAPPGFVNQVLEPLGGRIFKPKGWYYAENHGGPRHMWTISKEDISKGGTYTTGVRIQAFTGVKKMTGQTPKEFIEKFVAEKKKSADRVIKTCDAKEMQLFTRICLEVEEGPHHIMYSLFWGANDLDMAVISISGTTKEMWKEFSTSFDVMSAFELIDMKRFEDTAKPTSEKVEPVRKK